jgi:hypothetical protein
VKVQVAGRLGGAEMARTESYSDGHDRAAAAQLRPRRAQRSRRARGPRPWPRARRTGTWRAWPGLRWARRTPGRPRAA